MTRRLSFLLAAFVGAVLGLTLAAQAVPPQRTSSTFTTSATPFSVRCALPAPTAPAGYAALWETVPDAQWGGGDLGISVPMADGRDVWLYGDSWRPGAADGVYQVHSAALVQDRGCVHASDLGQQVVANDDATHVYWIHDARMVSASVISIRARLVVLTGSGSWGFTDGGFWRTNTYSVNASGNLVLKSTGPKVAGAAPVAGPFYTAAGVPTANPDPVHFYYSKQSHPEAHVPGGTLVTLAQNWGDDVFHHDPTWKAQNAPVWLVL